VLAQFPPTGGPETPGSNYQSSPPRGRKVFEIAGHQVIRTAGVRAFEKYIVVRVGTRRDRLRGPRPETFLADSLKHSGYHFFVAREPGPPHSSTTPRIMYLGQAGFHAAPSAPRRSPLRSHPSKADSTRLQSRSPIIGEASPAQGLVPALAGRTLRRTRLSRAPWRQVPSPLHPEGLS